MAARQRIWHGVLVRLTALAVCCRPVGDCLSGGGSKPAGTCTITISVRQGKMTHTTQVTLVVR